MYCHETVRKPEREKNKTRLPQVKNGCENPVENDDGEAKIGWGPPRPDKKRTVEGNLTPVECEDTHGQAVCDAEQLINHTIVGSDPAHPGEVRESDKEIERQEVYNNNQSAFKGNTFHDIMLTV